MTVRPTTEDLKSIHCHVMQTRDTSCQLKANQRALCQLSTNHNTILGLILAAICHKMSPEPTNCFLGINQRLEELIPERRVNDISLGVDIVLVSA